LLRETILKALEFKQIDIRMLHIASYLSPESWSHLSLLPALMPVLDPALHGSPEVTSVIGQSDKTANKTGARFALKKEKEKPKHRKGKPKQKQNKTQHIYKLEEIYKKKGNKTKTKHQKQTWRTKQNKPNKQNKK
jgi:hypothetical protein